MGIKQYGLGLLAGTLLTAGVASAQSTPKRSLPTAQDSTYHLSIGRAFLDTTNACVDRGAGSVIGYNEKELIIDRINKSLDIAREYKYYENDKSYIMYSDLKVALETNNVEDVKSWMIENRNTPCTYDPTNMEPLLYDTRNTDGMASFPLVFMSGLFLFAFLKDA